jgi:MerR family transcriptional regulator, redox-sensitive transcriptional activator SoxR
MTSDAEQLSAASPDSEQLTIGDVAARAGMTTSRIRYYEARGLIPEPERVAGKRRYTSDVHRRLAIIDAAQRVGFTLEEIRDLLGSRDQPAHERLRELALLKLPELDDLIARATSVRRVLMMCSRCDCESIDVCHMFDDRILPLWGYTARSAGARAPEIST